MSPCSLLKDHCVQHLPDGSVTVESILIQAAAHSEDPGTKVLLVSWTYQVREGPRKLAPGSGSGQAGSPLQPGPPRWGGWDYSSCVPLQDEELGSYLTSLLKKGLPPAPSGGS